MGIESQIKSTTQQPGGAMTAPPDSGADPFCPAAARLGRHFRPPVPAQGGQARHRAGGVEATAGRGPVVAPRSRRDPPGLRDRRLSLQDQGHRIAITSSACCRCRRSCSRRRTGSRKPARRSSSCSRAATPPARAARSSASWSISTRAAPASSRWRSRPSASARNGISSATSSTCPPAGEIVFFDRSWYNRAGVERVMGFCKPNEYLEFMRQCPELERMLVRSGIRLFKYWFSVTREEQRRRFAARETDPLKQWKLSPIDKASLDKWDDYTEAKEAMFFYTDTADAPWTIIKSDDKKRARLNCHAALPVRPALSEQGPSRRRRPRPADRRFVGAGHRRGGAHPRNHAAPGQAAEVGVLSTRMICWGAGSAGSVANGCNRPS